MREDRGRLQRDNSQDSLCSHTAVVINLLDKQAETKMEAFQTCTGDRPDIFVGSGFFDLYEGALPDWLHHLRKAWRTPDCCLGTGRPERCQLPKEPGNFLYIFLNDSSRTRHINKSE